MRFSTAPLLALLAAALAQAQQPKEPATIEAQSIEGIAGLEVTARGGVEFRQDDTTIYADYLKFNREFGRLEAEGGVRLQQGGDRFTGRGCATTSRTTPACSRSPRSCCAAGRRRAAAPSAWSSSA